MNESLAKSIAQNQLSRSISELIGVVTGIAADGHLHDLEILHLRTWLSAHQEVTQAWPGTAIAAAVDNILADGRVTEGERQHLMDTLTRLIGTDFASTGSVTAEPTSLPVEDGVDLDLKSIGVCFTGSFSFGTRAACERLAERHGSIVCNQMSRKVGALVIGSQSSPAWKQSSFGRKIEEAMNLREEGHPIAIISERRWIELIGSAA